MFILFFCFAFRPFSSQLSLRHGSGASSPYVETISYLPHQCQQQSLFTNIWQGKNKTAPTTTTTTIFRFYTFHNTNEIYVEQITIHFFLHAWHFVRYVHAFYPIFVVVFFFSFVGPTFWCVCVCVWVFLLFTIASS